ncbi:MAG TPA: dicarboxylate/amino acid:cation symporter [Caulobacterales bacterium]|nr:dicarboxylate/amino acid:cation symporter [Caulobacterales bacterium]
MKRRNFTLIVLIAMALGVALGWWLHAYRPGDVEAISPYFSAVTTIFLRLIQMVISPLVLTTLIVGIAHMGGGGALGRVGARTIGWFVLASITSLLLGLAIVHVLQPGVGSNLTLPPADASSGIEAGSINVQDFITHLVPRSIIDAMATNTILQIVVFAGFFGAALAAMGDEGKPVVDLAERVSHVMLRVVAYVMWTAPFAVFAAIAKTVAESGPEVLWTFGKFILGFYFALLVLWAVLTLLGFLIVGPRILTLIGMVREPTLVAFSTASSEAAYPRTFEQLQHFGVSRRIAGFVLPLGYSFNLDGSMMYCTFATIFIAQVYGIELSIAQQISMLLLLMITSKGMAGVPRASLVVIAATLTAFGLPAQGLVLILAVDHFLDMGRSATNVVGNSVASAIVAKWEKELGPKRPGAVAPVTAGEAEGAAALDQ